MTKGLPYSLQHASDRYNPVRRILVPLNPLEISIADVAGDDSHGTTVLSGLPEGFIQIVSGAFQIRASLVAANPATAIAAFNMSCAVGSVPTANNDLTDTGNNDIVGEAALGAATNGVSPIFTKNNIPVTATASLIDNTAADKEINLNYTLPDAHTTAGATAEFLLTGAIQLNYIRLFDD